MLVVLIVAAALVELLLPWPLKFLVDNVLGNHPLPDVVRKFSNLAADRTNLLVLVVASGLLLAVVANLLHVFRNYVETSIDQRIVLDFRSELFQHAQRLSLGFHEQKRSGMLIYTINAQGDSVAGLMLTVPILAQSAITLVGMFWILSRIDGTLAMLSLAVVPFLFLSVRYYARHIESRLVRVRGMEGESLSIVHEAMSMLRVIVAFGREPHEYDRFRNQGLRAVDARVDVTVRQTVFSLVVNLLTAVGTAAVLGYGARQALGGKLTVGDLLIVMAYLAAVYKPLEAITYTIGALQVKIVNLKMAFQLLDTAPQVKESPTARAISRAAGRLAFEAVDFSYSGRVDTLKGVSFETEPGHCLGIVGPTGAGKTTLISLIPRFYDTTNGRILLDGNDIRELSLKSLREQISMVLQEPLLFSGTIAENIRYGRLKAADAEVVEATRAANAHEFVMRLPKQYETVLGERGVKLSVGERQRLCIARAFLRDAPILILDEPTSAVDSRTEAVILEALDRLRHGRTSLMIAHRLSTIQHADRILVLDHGRLVEQGSHAELLERNGLYRQLHDMQHRQARRPLMRVPRE